MNSDDVHRGKHVKAAPLARSNITACIRCRQRKRRCDQQLPSCGLCRSAGVECVGYDAVARRHIPRSYVVSLEERVAYLEQTLRRHGVQYEDDEPTQSSDPLPTIVPFQARQQSEPSPSEVVLDNVQPQQMSQDITPAAVNDILDSIRGQVRRSSLNEPTCSMYLLAELMKLGTSPETGSLHKKPEQSFADDYIPVDVVDGLMGSQVSLPSRDAANNLVKAYFRFANLGLPLLYEPVLLEKLEFLYKLPPLVDFDKSHDTAESRTAVFFVFEVFAIALMIMQKHGPSRVPITMADHYHTLALKALGLAALPNNLEGVQALLLAAQYVYHHPHKWAVWKTTGCALLLATELGLHRDPPPACVTDYVTLDTMRRVFWVAYSMEMSLSISLSMPSCISDGVITAKFPSPVDDKFITPTGVSVPEGMTPLVWSKSLSIHLFRYRQLQSEIRRVLYETPPPTLPAPDLEIWQVSMRSHIHIWHDQRPAYHDNLTAYERQDLENFDLSFYRILIYLYKPSVNITNPSGPALLALMDASNHAIELYRQFFREYRLTVYWQAIENLSTAGTALLYSYVHSPLVQEHMTFHSLERVIRTCSTVLSGMVEHFPSFKGKRDAFDTVASKTLDELAAANANATRVPAATFVWDESLATEPRNDGLRIDDIPSSASERSRVAMQSNNNILLPSFDTDDTARRRMLGTHHQLGLNPGYTELTPSHDEVGTQIQPALSEVQGADSFDFDFVQGRNNSLLSGWLQ